MSTATPRGNEARRVLRRFHAGVIGTRSHRYPDHPYTAAMPACTDQQGRIVVFISHLAEHTRGIADNARVSFTVAPLQPGLRPETRVTVLGTAVRNDDPHVAARYLRFFPDNRSFLEIGGFHFHIIEPDHVRLIAGFGSAHWLAGASMLAERLPLGQAEEDILGHMNSDHQHNLVSYSSYVHGIDAAKPEMVGIDCDGFDVRADNSLYRFDFENPLSNADEARTALVALAKAARG